MADVQDSSQAAEPSMEEILASIRRIISDDQPAAGTAPAADDIIELTQSVQDDGTVVDLAAVDPEPVPETVLAAPPPPPPPPPLPPPPTESLQPPAQPVSTLVSDRAVGEASSALSALANTVEIERLAHEPTAASYIGNGSRTLEDMVIELMRPLLKQWLDENLPATVERLVQKEIERIARRS